jgi:hypothetical protein
MRSGASLAEVERTVIAPATLSRDRKAALWLYAWSCDAHKCRRREAIDRIVRLKTSRDASGVMLMGG